MANATKTFGTAQAVIMVDENGIPLTADNSAALNTDQTNTLGAGTDRSGSIAVAGTSQVLAAANTARKGLRIQNISAGDLWVNQTGGAAAVDTAASFKIAAGATFEVMTNQAVAIVGATLGQKFSATEV